MSSFSSPDAPQSNLPPVRPTNSPQADPVLTPPVPDGGSWFLPLVGCGAVVFFGLLLICGGVYTAFQVASTEELFKVEPPPPPVEEITVNVRLLDGDWENDIDRKTRSKAGRFLSQLEEVSANEGQEAFMRLVDLDAHMERCYSSFRHALDYMTKRELDDIERNSFNMPQGAGGYRIAAIEEPNEGDLLVYAYAQEQEMANTPYVFHLRSDSSGRLKLVDWQEIPERIWAASFDGTGAGPIDGDFDRTRQEEIYSDLQTADNAMNIGDYAAAETAISQAEWRGGISSLADRNRYLIARRWQWIDRPDEALRICNETESPGEYPWLDLIKAEIYSDRDEHEKVLECAERYEAAAGFHWSVMLYKSNALRALGRTDEAVAATIAVVKHQPDNYQSLTALFTNVPADRFSEAIADAPTTPDFINQLIGRSSSLLSMKKPAMYDAVRAFVAEHAADKSALVKLDANRLHYQGNLEEALDLYEKRLAGLDNKSDDFSTALYDVASLSFSVYEPIEAYDKTKHPRELISLLYDDVEYDGELVTYEDFTEIAGRHIEKDPSDPMNHRYKVFVAVQDEDWKQVKQETLAALDALTDSELDEYEAENLRYTHHQALYHLDEWRDAYRKAEDKDDFYLDLAPMILLGDGTQNLKELNELHAENSKSLWLKFYQIRVAEEEAKETDSERSQRALIRRYRFLKSENALTEEIYPYSIQSRITALTVQSENWREAFNEADEAENLFRGFVNRFQERGDEKGLNEFVALFRSRFPENIALKSHELEKLISEKKYQQVIAKTSPWPPAETGNTYFPVYQWRQLRFRSQLILGDFVGAQQTANLPDVDHSLQLALLIAQGDAAGIKALLEDEETQINCSVPPNPEWMPAPSFAKFVKSPEFRSILSEHPPWLNREDFSQRAMMLFEEPVELSKSSIETSLQEADRADAIVEILQGEAMVSQTARITLNGRHYLLSWSRDNAEKQDALLPAPDSTPADVATVMKKCPHWISLEEVAQAGSAKPSDFYSIANLVADGARAFLTDDENYTSHVGLFENGFEAARDQGEKLRQSLDVFEGYMVIPTGNNRPETPNMYLDNSRRCRQMAGGKASGEAQITIRCGGALERHWLTITEVKHTGWDGYELIAKFQDDSQLNTFIHSGDVVRIHSYEITDWRD